MLVSVCIHCDPDLWATCIFLIMDNIWTKLTGLYVFHKVVPIFVHCDLELSSLTLTINRDHPLTMDSKCTCTRFDQDYNSTVWSLYSVQDVISVLDWFIWNAWKGRLTVAINFFIAINAWSSKWKEGKRLEKILILNVQELNLNIKDATI